jgi:hypothetical protein
VVKVRTDLNGLTESPDPKSPYVVTVKDDPDFLRATICQLLKYFDGFIADGTELDSEFDPVFFPNHSYPPPTLLEFDPIDSMLYPVNEDGPVCVPIGLFQYIIV